MSGIYIQIIVGIRLLQDREYIGKSTNEQLTWNLRGRVQE